MGGTHPGDDQQEAENFCPATDIAMGAAGREPRGVEITMRTYRYRPSDTLPSRGAWQIRLEN